MCVRMCVWCRCEEELRDGVARLGCRGPGLGCVYVYMCAYMHEPYVFMCVPGVAQHVLYERLVSASELCHDQGVDTNPNPKDSVPVPRMLSS